MRKAVTLAIPIFLASAVYAQTPAAGGSDLPKTRHSGAPLGQFEAGPFVITPTFRIGTLAVDTNIQYERERKADFLASGGPGLDIGLPFLDHWQLVVSGSSQYFYFWKTTELRRWTGAGTVTLNWATVGTRASVSASRGRDFARPSLEVDTRIASKETNVLGTFDRNLGRLTLSIDSTWVATRIDAGQEYRGADIARALSTDRYAIRPRLHYPLTPFSSVFFEGGYQAVRFPGALARNFHEESAGLGLGTKYFYGGTVSAGVRRSALTSRLAARTRPYFRVNFPRPTIQRGRFALSGTYTHDSTVSAFAEDGDLPTFERRALMLDLRIKLGNRLSFTVGGTRETVTSDGRVVVVLDDGTRASEKRDDVAYIGRAGLGLGVGRAEISAYTSYTTRQSRFFDDFGIEGLQVGLRVEYAQR